MTVDDDLFSIRALFYTDDGVPFLPSLEDVTITASSAMEKPVRIFAIQNCVDTRTRVRTLTLIHNYTNKHMYIHIHIYTCTLFWIGFSIMMSTFHFIPSFLFLLRLISVSNLLSFLLFLLPYFLPYFLYFLSLQTFSLIFFFFPSSFILYFDRKQLPRRRIRRCLT